ncbi:MAG TPA: hypothetical protein VMZ71_14115, partial [Gemmataceae bacterium]|nr:hypothetical protein [Gemmataceae bacterium]
ACRNTPDRTQQTNLPLVAVDTTTGKKVVDTTWASGSVHFTADSSRVLVAERSGRCRWFKLSNGDEDGGWVFPNPGPAHAHEFYSMSDDGSVIGYGGPGGKGGARGSLLLDGATGDTLRALPEAAYSPHSTLQVSGDGRRAAVLRNGGPGDNGRASIVDILDTGTGDVVARAAKVGLTNSVPTYRMTRDGRSLFIHEGDSGTFQMFDLPADPKGAK